MNLQPFASTQGRPETHDQLRGRRLLIARAIWIAIAVLAVGTYAFNLPVIFDQVRTVCVADECILAQLAPEAAPTRPC